VNLIPSTVVIAVPKNIPERRGRHAVTPPHGVILTVRTPVATMDAVDLAITRIDPTMSRGLFVRLVIANAANAFNEAYDEIQTHVKDVSYE